METNILVSLRLKVHWTIIAVSVALWRLLFSAWCLQFRSWKLCLLWELSLWAAWKTGFLCTRLGAWMWNAGAEVSKAFRDVQTKCEMKCLNEIWKLSGEEMVRTWVCTYFWQYLQAGWRCCQGEFGAASVKCCEKCMPMPLLPTSSGCSCTFPPSTWLAPLEMSLRCAGEDITWP